MITLKRPREIELMRAAGRLVAQAHGLARGMIEPGVTTAEIDTAVEKLFERFGAQPLLKGFPAGFHFRQSVAFP